MGSLDVLNRLLKKEVLKPAPKAAKAPGRPKVADEKKAKNFTLCLAPQYLQFLDRMKVKEAKVQGRGRKIRFIIDRFIEHEKRSLSQMRVLKEALSQVKVTIKNIDPKNLSPRETTKITSSVDQVHTLLKILNYGPKTLKRILPPDDWRLLAFCLDWKNNRGVIL